MDKCEEQSGEMGQRCRIMWSASVITENKGICDANLSKPFSAVSVSYIHKGLNKVSGILDAIAG
jgi:hypothetical protein